MNRRGMLRSLFGAGAVAAGMIAVPEMAKATDIKPIHTPPLPTLPSEGKVPSISFPAMYSGAYPPVNPTLGSIWMETRPPFVMDGPGKSASPVIRYWVGDSWVHMEALKESNG